MPSAGGRKLEGWRKYLELTGGLRRIMAERVGFEPTVRFPVRSLSRRVLSTTQSPLRVAAKGILADLDLQMPLQKRCRSRVRTHMFGPSHLAAQAEK